MITAEELFRPLVVCTSAPEPRLRGKLTTSVLNVMTGCGGTLISPLDPAWMAVAPLLPPPRTAPPVTPAAGPAPGILPLRLPEQAPADLVGRTIELHHPLGGVDTRLLGVLVSDRPALLRISVDLYEEWGEPVPDFLRAYNGLRALGVGWKNARYLVRGYPAPPLLAAVIRAYRAGLRGPSAYAHLQAQLLEHLDPPPRRPLTLRPSQRMGRSPRGLCVLRSPTCAGQ